MFTRVTSSLPISWERFLCRHAVLVLSLGPGRVSVSRINETTWSVDRSTCVITIVNEPGS